MKPLNKLSKYIVNTKHKTFNIALKLNTLFRGYNGYQRHVYNTNEYNYLRYQNNQIKVKMSISEQFKIKYKIYNYFIDTVCFDLTYFNNYGHSDLDRIYYKLNGNTVYYYNLLCYMRNIYSIKNKKFNYLYNNNNIFNIQFATDLCEYDKVYLYYRDNQLINIQHIHCCEDHSSIERSYVRQNKTA